MSELFANFEVNKDPKWPILMRLTGGSLLLHLVLVWSVVYIPAFRDALNIAALIANTRFVDKPYSRTQIADDITFVDLTSQKFRYPDGYFAVAGEQPAGELVAGNTTPDPFAPKIISRASSSNSEPLANPSPSPLLSPSPSPSPSASAAAIADSNKTLTPEEAQKKLEQTAAENNLELPDETQLNKQALKDFALFVNDQKAQGKINLDQPFEVVVEGELDQNGKLVNARLTKKSGDPNLVDLFKRMVEALNDSGFLVYLKPISKDNPNATVRFTIKQGESDVLASVESEASSPASAVGLAKALNLALVFGAGSRQGKDEEVLMRNTNATQDGKKVVVNFQMPRQNVLDMIQKQLKPGA